MSSLDVIAATRRASEVVLIRFTPDAGRTDFLENCKLAAHTALRVLTRSARAGEGPSATRCYLGLPNPVWNNTGDRATLYDEFFDYARKGDWPKSRLTSFGYGTQQYSEPNDTGPIVLAPAPPAANNSLFLSECHIRNFSHVAYSNSAGRWRHRHHHNQRKRHHFGLD